MNKLHTNGPWEVKITKATKAARVAPEIFARFGKLGGEGVVARAYAWGDQRAPRTQEEKWIEMVHNAYLISAAPDLLAAVELAVGFLMRHHAPEGEARILVRILQTAASKAEPKEIP